MNLTTRTCIILHEFSINMCWSRKLIHPNNCLIIHLELQRRVSIKLTNKRDKRLKKDFKIRQRETSHYELPIPSLAAIILTEKINNSCGRNRLAKETCLEVILTKQTLRMPPDSFLLIIVGPHTPDKQN